MERVPTLEGRGKKKHRTFCDRFHITYGRWPARDLTAEEGFALWIDQKRQDYKKAIALSVAIKAALGKGHLPYEWFDALANFEEEVNELAYKATADRQMKESLDRELRGMR